MPFGPTETGPRHGVMSRPIAWLAIGLFLLAASIDRHDSIRWEIGVRPVAVRPPPPATEADVREMLNHD